MRMITHEEFLHIVYDFQEETGLYRTDVGKVLLNNGAFIKRLEEGNSPTLKTVDKVLKAMEEYRALMHNGATE